MFHITEIFNQSFRWGRFQIWKQRSRVLFLLDNETDSFVAFEFLVFLVAVSKHLMDFGFD